LKFEWKALIVAFVVFFVYLFFAVSLASAETPIMYFGDSLTSSLTSGSVLFSDGVSIAEDNSNLFWDNINKNFGMGTTTPKTIASWTGTTQKFFNIKGTPRTYLAVQGNPAEIALIDTGGAVNDKWASIYMDNGKLRFRSLTDAGSARQSALFNLDMGANLAGFWTDTPSANVHIYKDDALGSAELLIEQDGIGDATIGFVLTDAERFMMGLDNNDGDKFKIAESTSLGSNDIFQIDPVTHQTDIFFDLNVTGNYIGNGSLLSGVFPYNQTDTEFFYNMTYIGDYDYNQSGINPFDQVLDQSSNVTFENVTASQYEDDDGVLGFGEWNSTVSFAVSYLAETDGFVTSFAETEGSGGRVQLYGYTDGSDPPTTLILVEDCIYSSGSVGCGFTMPVRKGDYWIVKNYSSGSHTKGVRWLPNRK
jgi:hypothetical protein